jgi:hypothetical protein
MVFYQLESILMGLVYIDAIEPFSFKLWLVYIYD